MDEFDLIRQYFCQGKAAAGVAVAIGDDGAVLDVDSERQQIQVIDTLVEGVHFPPGTDAADIGWRVVAVNLSDIAAMGGEPRWMTLALTLSSSDEDWLTGFAAGLFAAADRYQVALIGGDTTSGPVIVATVNITGEVKRGAALLRSGANAGDAIYVTGTLGDAAAGLSLLKSGEPDAYLLSRFLRPTPRIETGRRLCGRATAAIDVSDGLAGDLGKLLAASGLGAELELECLPRSDALRARFSTNQQIDWALKGGDDYELCFTAPEHAVADVPGITRIGTVTAERELRCRLQGDVVEFSDSGYRHFQ